MQLGVRTANPAQILWSTPWLARKSACLFRDWLPSLSGTVTCAQLKLTTSEATLTLKVLFSGGFLTPAPDRHVVSAHLLLRKPQLEHLKTGDCKYFMNAAYFSFIVGNETSLTERLSEHRQLATKCYHRPSASTGELMLALTLATRESAKRC